MRSRLPGGSPAGAGAPPNRGLLLPELLGNAFASLVLAVGFAGLARRRGSEGSLLENLRAGWHQTRQQRLRRCGNREARLRQHQSDQDYVEAIGPAADEDSRPPAPSNRHR